MKICQMVDYTRRSRRKQVGKWERESAAQSKFGCEKGVLYLCACSTLYMAVSINMWFHNNTAHLPKALSHHSHGRTDVPCKGAKIIGV